MAKKPKAPHNNNNNNNNKVKNNDDPNIFKTLFGDIPEQNNSVSIFSTDNPFRRKPSNGSQTPQKQEQQVGLGFDSVAGDYEKSNLDEVKKRKRNKEKKPSSDSTSKTPSEVKKSRRVDLESSNFGVNDLGFGSKESKKGGKGKKHNLGLELEEVLEKGKEKEEPRELNDLVSSEKKKRKRDELEAEYEARRYGVVATNDEGGEGGLGGKIVGEKRKKVDDPADMMVSKDGFDDEAKLLRTVFVGNLPLKVKKKALLKEFSQFGEIESVRIRSVPLLDTKTPRKGAIIQKKINDAIDSVHAYIVFKIEEAAQASLAHNMAVVGGNHIRVDRACPPRKKLKADNAPLYDNKRTVFVGNLPFDVKDEEIYQFFSGIKDLEESSIEAIRVIRDPGTSVGKGIAYVLFKTRGAANLVVKKRSLKLRDRELRLCHAKSNLTPSKRKNPSPTERNSSPTKKVAADSRTTDSYNKVKTNATSSYQGLRASKSGAQKKGHRKVIEPVKLKFNTQKVEKSKERTTKRPSVAARKANALKGGGASKQTGTKRKLGNQTPESSSRPNKKTKKFR